MLVSSYSLTPPSETRKTLGGRKKLLLGWSLSAVSPPSPDEDATPPRTRVFNLKSHKIYSDDPSLLTSGMCSTEQLVHYTSTSTIHDPEYIRSIPRDYDLGVSQNAPNYETGTQPCEPLFTDTHQPCDGEDTTSRQRSSDSTSSTGSQRSKISSRKPLANRHHPYRLSKKPDDDDDDDDKDGPGRGSHKIPTRCEQDESELVETAKTKRTSLPGRLRTEDSPDALEDINSKQNASMMSETSFFKILGFAKSWIAGTYNDTIVESSETHPLSHLPATLPSPIADYTLPTAVSPCPSIPVILIHTSEEDKNTTKKDPGTPSTPMVSEPSKDAFYTGHGNPEITPVPRIRSRDAKHTLKNFLHTPSLSPRQIIQERHSARRHSFTNRITEATPKAGQLDVTSGRTRHVSEGDATSISAKHANVGRLQYKRYLIRDLGSHECDGNHFELSNCSFLDRGPEISRDSLQAEIKATLRKASPNVSPGQAKAVSTELFWCPDVISKLTNDNRISQSPTTTSSPPNAGAENSGPMENLLVSINHHVRAITKQEVLFNGLQLIYSFDRTSRIPLKNRHKNDNLPFVILHIGKPRDLSITPLRFNPAVEVTEVCDVSLGNYSILTVLPEASQNLHIFFSPEMNPLSCKDEQVLIVPFIEKNTDMQTAAELPIQIMQQSNPAAPASIEDIATTKVEISLAKVESLVTEEEHLATKEVNTAEPSTTKLKSPLRISSCSQKSEDTQKQTIKSTPDDNYESLADDKLDPTDPDECSSITLKYITLDLLKRAASSYKKSTLSTLMTSLGLKGSNNVSLNKKKLCDLLETCESTGSKNTVKLLTHLINKLEETVIRMELLANYLPLSLSAQERKKALISFCSNQCIGNSNAIRLVFENPGEKDESNSTRNILHLQNTPTLRDQPSPKYVTPDGPLSGNTDTKFQFGTPEDQSCTKSSKKKKGKSHKKKKKKGSNNTSPRVPLDSHQNSPVAPHTGIPLSADGPTIEITEDKETAGDMRLKGHLTNTECSNCSELKAAVTVLQDSIITLSEEILQQKAISDLIISSPTASDKKLEVVVKKKLSPIEDKVNQLRADLNLLREAVDEQNNTLNIVANTRTQPSPELRAEFANCFNKLEATNIANRKQFETLELGQDNLKKAVKSVANTAKNQSQATADELKGELNLAFQSFETVSCSNRTRIEALEVNHESLTQALISSQQPPANHKPAHRDTPASVDDTNRESEHGIPWSSIVENGGSEKFTTSNKKNSKNHKENVHVPATGQDSRSKAKSEIQPNQLSREATESRNESSKRIRESYRKHTVLLIHDSNFDHFNPKMFNSQFNVHCLKVDSYDNMTKKSKLLNSTIKRLKPECVYVHTGINDLLKKKSGIVSIVEEFSEHLMNTTKAQICFSGLIPSSNDRALNERISIVNKDVEDYVSWLHIHKPGAKDRIFTFKNDSIGDQNLYTSNEGFKLRERGQKMLWVRLREGLRKTMRLPRVSYQPKGRSRRSTNRFSDE